MRGSARIRTPEPPPLTGIPVAGSTRWARRAPSTVSTAPPDHAAPRYPSATDATARPVVEETFAVETLAVELADPRFYHMDTALCPLPGGEVLYVPQAFTAAGLKMIEERIAPNDRLAIEPEDAERLAAAIQQDRVARGPELLGRLEVGQVPCDRHHHAEDRRHDRQAGERDRQQEQPALLDPGTPRRREVRPRR